MVGRPRCRGGMATCGLEERVLLEGIQLDFHESRPKMSQEDLILGTVILEEADMPQGIWGVMTSY